MFNSTSSGTQASVWWAPAATAESNSAPVVNAWLSALDVSAVEGGSSAALAFTLATSSAVPLEAAVATMPGRAAIVRVLTALGWWGSSAFRLRLSESVLGRVAGDGSFSRSERASQVATLLRAFASSVPAVPPPPRDAGEAARAQWLQASRDAGHAAVLEVRTLLAKRPDDAELRAFHALQRAHLNSLGRPQPGSASPLPPPPPLSKPPPPPSATLSTLAAAMPPPPPQLSKPLLLSPSPGTPLSMPPTPQSTPPTTQSTLPLSTPLSTPPLSTPPPSTSPPSLSTDRPPVDAASLPAEPACAGDVCDGEVRSPAHGTRDPIDSPGEHFAPTLGPGSLRLGGADADTGDRDSDNRCLHEVSIEAGSHAAAGGADADASGRRQREALAQAPEPQEAPTLTATSEGAACSPAPGGFEPAPAHHATYAGGGRSVPLAAWVGAMIVLAVGLPPAFDLAADWVTQGLAPHSLDDLTHRLLPERVTWALPARQSAGPGDLLAALDSLRRSGGDRRRVQELTELQRRVDRLEAALSTLLLAAPEHGMPAAAPTAPGSVQDDVGTRARAADAVESARRLGVAGMRPFVAPSGPAGDLGAPIALRSQSGERVPQAVVAGGTVPDGVPADARARNAAGPTVGSRPTFGAARSGDDTVPSVWPLGDAAHAAEAVEAEVEAEVEALARRLADLGERLDVLEQAFEQLRDRLAAAAERPDRPAGDGLTAMRRWAESGLAKVRALRAEVGPRAGAPERRIVVGR